MTEPTTEAGKELLASIYILVSGKDGEQEVRDWSRDRILAIEAEARATAPLDVERLRRYVVNNRDVWTDEPSDPPGARQLAMAYRDIYQKMLNVLEGREPLDDGNAEYARLTAEREQK